ncbi:DUF2811 domain-containing protein [Prochlorococcus marinus]|uniref:DUF2811 domain-containing protein n=1 Tax=Prochlorococcus marinus TaxID=1219 RepID=UPI0022B2C038|nr:DUF2811 domain-containing protein [Prochlorococcus marinus]
MYDKGKLIESSNNSSQSEPKDSIISFQANLPLSLKESMNDFIEKHPNWDQYRLIKAALAGFLVQNGVDSRPITRLYIGNMFKSNALID